MGTLVAAAAGCARPPAVARTVPIATAASILRDDRIPDSFRSPGPARSREARQPMGFRRVPPEHRHTRAAGPRGLWWARRLPRSKGHLAAFGPRPKAVLRSGTDVLYLPSSSGRRLSEKGHI